MSYQILEDNIYIWSAEDVIDPGVLVQLQNCARTGNVARVVVQPDVHRGFTQAVGTSVAYNGQISPKGVGPDIACFTGDTKVRLTDGRDITFVDLVNEDAKKKQNFCYSLDEYNDVVISRVENPRIVNSVTTFIQITLDNEQKIVCTEDHIFYQRNGTQIQADKITVGTSLMPLYINEAKEVEKKKITKKLRSYNKNYLVVYNPGKDTYTLIHALADEFNLRNGVYRAGDSLKNGKFEVRHHVDFNKYNNDPTNIIRMDEKDHFEYHSTNALGRELSGQGFRESHRLYPEMYSKRSSETMTKLHQDPEFQKRRNARASKTFKRWVRSFEFAELVKTYGLRGAKYLREYNKTDEAKRKASLSSSMPQTCSVCGTVFDNKSEIQKHRWSVHRDGYSCIACEEHFATVRQLKNHQSKIHPTLKYQCLKCGEFISKIHYGRHVRNCKNHCVILVERITTEPTEVYCLTVENYHNFALSSGVFVHNCGIIATKLDLTVDNFTPQGLINVADTLEKKLSFGLGRKNAERVEDELFDAPVWGDIPYLKALKDNAVNQLGTIGSGNHFVNVLVDKNNQLWVMAHFGSRGTGFKIAKGFLNLAKGKGFEDRGGEGNEDDPPILLDMDSDLGQQYYLSMLLAGKYAYAGREWVARKVVSILGGRIIDVVHNHHNWAFKENHFGKDYIVVRKGATSNFPDQRSVIGGSMGDYSAIIVGKNTDESRESFNSTLHGSGRVMSRTQAAGKMNYKTHTRSGGKITREEMFKAVDNFGVILRGGDTDESPFVYRSLAKVLEPLHETTEVQTFLKPLIVIMAPRNNEDPFKD